MNVGENNKTTITKENVKKESTKKKALSLAKVLVMAVVVVVILSLAISGLKSLFPGKSTLGNIVYTSVLDGPVRTPFADSVENNLLGMHLDREDPSPTPAPEIDINSVNYEDYGQKIVVGSSAYDSFKFNDEEIKSLADSINSSSKSLPSEINIFSMIVPTSAGVMLPHSYISDNYSKFTDQQNASSTINSFLNDNIAGLDIYSTLKANTDQKLYYSTENKWTSLGAYYAYTVWANRRGNEFYPLNGYQKKTIDGYSGYLYAYIGSSKIQSPETIEYYEPTSMLSIDGKPLFSDVSEKSSSNKIDLFLGGKNAETVITNDSLSDGSVGVIVGDHSAYSLVPYLAEYYETTYFIDFTLYEDSLGYLVRNTKAVDVTYCVSIETCQDKEDILKLQNLK